MTYIYDATPATLLDVERICLETMKNQFTEYFDIKEELRKIRSGEVVVIPADLEHAKFMLRIAQHYISEVHNETIRAIKQEG